jgi:hypothetical protein
MNTVEALRLWAESRELTYEHRTDVKSVATPTAGVTVTEWPGVPGLLVRVQPRSHWEDFAALKPLLRVRDRLNLKAAVTCRCDQRELSFHDLEPYLKR